MPNKPDRDSQRAIEIITQYNPQATQPYVSEIVPLRDGNDGKLVYVNYKQVNEAGNEYQTASIVYFPFYGEPMRYERPEDFIKWYSDRPKASKGVLSVIDPEKLGGVAGLIALIICCTICWRYAHFDASKTFEVPAVLSSALSSIIGFYFGTKAKDATQKISELQKPEVK